MTVKIAEQIDKMTTVVTQIGPQRKKEVMIL